MKNLIQFCEANGLELVPVTYRSNGIKNKRKGYDIVRPSDRAILVSFEPKDYRSGEKWHVRNSYAGYAFTGERLHRITPAHLEAIDVNSDSFFKLM